MRLVFVQPNLTLTNIFFFIILHMCQAVIKLGLTYLKMLVVKQGGFKLHCGSFCLCFVNLSLYIDNYKFMTNKNSKRRNYFNLKNVFTIVSHCLHNFVTLLLHDIFCKEYILVQRKSQGEKIIIQLAKNIFYKVDLCIPVTFGLNDSPQN